jgi:CheY-like chemotaxis protein/HPt (histidine-containing phosphotransfer) domain-containing protein
MSEPASETEVLIVDDDPVMGELLDALLTYEGYRITRALSGEEALQVVREGSRKPGVILCDIHMPGMHGGELAGALADARAEGVLSSGTVILAMSGSLPRAEESQSFDGFLRKPFAVADFTEAMEQARTRTPRSAIEEDEQPSTQENSSRRPLDDKIFEQLKAKIGGEPLRQLYDMTLEDVRARLDRIAEAAERGDYATVRQEAHTIKGSCGMVGALELQVLAAATEGGSPIDTSALADFDSACNRLERMLNERLQA